MTLKHVHLAFIICSLFLSLGLLAWGIRAYRIDPTPLSLGLALVGGAGLVVLLPYSRWFSKKIRNLPVLALIAAALLVTPTTVWACAVCFKDPESAMVQGAQNGVLFLAIVVYLLAVSIIGIGWFWWRRARKLGHLDSTLAE